MSIFLRPIMTRMFLFMYLIGIMSSILTVPPYKTAHMYQWAPYELFADVYIIVAIWLVIKGLLYKEGATTIGRKMCNWAYRLLLTVFYVSVYVLYIADMFCFVKFGSTLNPSMLLLIGETTGNEAGEFLQSYVTPDIIFSEVGAIVLVPLLHAGSFLFRAYRSNKSNETNRTNRNYWTYKHFCGGAVAIAVGVCLYLTYPNKQMYLHTMTLDTIGQVEHSLAYHPHTELYQPPMRLAFSIRCNQLIGQQLGRLKATIGKVEVDSCSVKSPEIVLIIGESFNKRHAQLYGYDKANMPNQVRMEKEGLLTKFEDVVAPWNLTSFVFKLFMTTYCVGDEGEWCDYPLFCEIFRKAGYNVNFMTNQFQTKAKQEVYDFSGGFFINDEELSSVQFDHRNNRLHVFDEGLLKDYDAMVDLRCSKGQNIEKQLQIFHLMGMHVTYRIRCPNRMKKWGVSEYPDDTDIPPKKRKVLADYDNSVWYNDSIVNQIVERFKNDDAIIIYIPDHGEEVFGPGARHFFGRMHNAVINKRLADEEFRIPMWIYTTPLYAKNHPNVVAAIKAAAPKKYMTDALSHLLIGLAGIHTKYYKPQYDILSPQYDESRRRLLKNNTDYDTLK
ncbi:MAG: phosphoethanolamine transferase [Prevotella sp.]|nr:phosphoethanolamine transferase [Prevotella sp.]